MKLTRIGVDIAKQVFQLHGTDRSERTVWWRRVTRERWLQTLREVAEPCCEVGLEACGGAHHWAPPQAMGYRIKLIASMNVSTRWIGRLRASRRPPRMPCACSTCAAWDRSWPRR